MTAYPQSTSLQRFETELRKAASAFIDQARQSKEVPASLPLGLARSLGLPPLTLEALLAASRREKASWVDRLRIENGRLLRAARRNAPLYDLGRHMAIRRLLDRLISPDDECVRPEVPTSCHPLSGRELNNRFRGRRQRRLEVSPMPIGGAIGKRGIARP